MHFLITLLLCFPYALTDSCNFQDTPIGVNDNDEDTRYFKGCITNATFPNEVVTSLNVDCSGAQPLEELPENFLSYFGHLKEVVIKCGVKTIQPNAFSHTPSLVDLDLSGNQLSAITAGSFSSIPSLQYLNLSNNAIVLIEDNGFANLPRLADLDLSRNALDYLNRAWFVNTSAVEEFRFNNNFLKEIPAGMFSDWTKTYAFNFDYNRIGRLRDMAFASEINYLTLHHNELTEINPKAFPNNVIITQLDISGNLLNYLPLDFFKRVRLMNVWLFGNPFECACLKTLEGALEQRRIKVMTVQPKVAAEDRCLKASNVPVCGVSNGPARFCNGTEDAELIGRINGHMRKFGFADSRDWYEQCTVMPTITYLDT